MLSVYVLAQCLPRKSLQPIWKDATFQEVPPFAESYVPSNVLRYSQSAKLA